MAISRSIRIFRPVLDTSEPLVQLLWGEVLAQQRFGQQQRRAPCSVSLKTSTLASAIHSSRSAMPSLHSSISAVMTAVAVAASPAADPGWLFPCAAAALHLDRTRRSRRPSSDPNSQSRHQSQQSGENPCPIPRRMAAMSTAIECATWWRRRASRRRPVPSFSHWTCCLMAAAKAGWSAATARMMRRNCVSVRPANSVSSSGLGVVENSVILPSFLWTNSSRAHAWPNYTAVSLSWLHFAPLPTYNAARSAPLQRKPHNLMRVPRRNTCMRRTATHVLALLAVCGLVLSACAAPAPHRR